MSCAVGPDVEVADKAKSKYMVSIILLRDILVSIVLYIVHLEFDPRGNLDKLIIEELHYYFARSIMYVLSYPWEMELEPFNYTLYLMDLFLNTIKNYMH